VDTNQLIVIILLFVVGGLLLMAISSRLEPTQPVIVIQPAQPSTLSEPQLTGEGIPPREKEVTCMVVVPELMNNAPVEAPAVETAIIRELLLAGFSVVDQQMVDKIRYRDETLLAAYRNDEAALAALRALAYEYSADVLVIGTAFTEGEFSAPEGLVSTRAWTAVRAVDVRTGRLFSAEQTSAGGADMTLTIAAKKALQNAGEVIGQSVTKALEKRFGKQRGTQDRVELIIVAIPLDAYAFFKQQLQNLPYVKQIISDHYTADEAHMTIYYTHVDLIDLVNYFRYMDLRGGRLEVLTYSLARVVIRYRS